MADSSLDPDHNPLPDRSLGTGHGTDALGPSGISDTGSDVVGNNGMVVPDDDAAVDAEMVGEDDNPHAGVGAGPDIGDANLDSDSDEQGTGERATAGRDTSAEPGSDIGVDQVVQAGEMGIVGGLDEAELADIDPVFPDDDRARRGRQQDR